jgi:hypothetical protein
MIKHPPIAGRRQLSEDLADIHNHLMALIVRLDLLGEFAVSSRIVEAVEALVETPPSSELPQDEQRAIEESHHAYHQAIDAERARRAAD